MRGTVFILVALALSGAWGCNGDSPRNRRRLAEAARDGNYKRVVRFLGGGVKPDAKDEYGDSALGGAARMCHKDIVAALLEKGASPNALRGSEDAPLIDVVTFTTDQKEWCPDGPAIGEMLLRAGANANGIVRKCQTPLHRAYSRAAVEFLLAHKADPNLCDKVSPVAVSLSEAPKALEAYLKGGGNPNGKLVANGKTALHDLADYQGLGTERVEAMRILLKYKANPNLADKVGFTPLDYAVRNNFELALALLKEHGAKQGYEIEQDPAVYAAQEARAERILEDGGHNCRHQCRFEVTGDDMATSGTESSWAIIQGTSAVVTARCQESGYLHYAVRTSNVKGRMPRQINLPVSAGQTSLPMRFADEWRNGHMTWFFSPKPIDELTMAVEQSQVTCAASIDVTVAPLNGRVIGQGRKR